MGESFPQSQKPPLSHNFPPALERLLRLLKLLARWAEKRFQALLPALHQVDSG
jgi:hypothetical protein